MRDGSSSDEETKRWKIAIKHVNVIDLEVVMQYCKADEHVPRNEEAMLTGQSFLIATLFSCQIKIIHPG